MEDRFDIVKKETRFIIHLTDFCITFVMFLIYVFSMGKKFRVIQNGDFLRPLGGLLLYLSYYIGFELNYARTPGKFITKTKIVNTLGEEPSSSQIIKRNMSRLIPLDDISFLFSKRGWHDILSETYIIKDMQTRL